MKRRLLISLCLFFLATELPEAQTRQTLFNGNLKFNAMGLPVVIPLRINQQPQGAGARNTRLTVTAQVDRLLPAINQQLVNTIRQLHAPCEHRWAANNPRSGLTGQGLILKVRASYQSWFCSDLFTYMLFTEAGTIETHIQPQISNGRLQFRLTYFVIHGLSQIANLIGVQGFIQDEVQKFLNQLNNNPEVARLPRAYRELGYVYQDIRVGNLDGIPTVKIGITGSNQPGSLEQLKRFLNSFTQ